MNEQLLKVSGFREKKTSLERKGASTSSLSYEGQDIVSFPFFRQLDCFTAKDLEKLDNITKVVLLPEKTTAQRKARVSKYLHWVSSCNSSALTPVWA